jgi:hypothetical protein
MRRNGAAGSYAITVCFVTFELTPTLHLLVCPLKACCGNHCGSVFPCGLQCVCVCTYVLVTLQRVSVLLLLRLEITPDAVTNTLYLKGKGPISSIIFRILWHSHED